MKIKILFIICNLLIYSLIFAQNITNTLGTSGVFKIKDGSADYLSLSQSTGYLSLNRSLTLSNTTGSAIGVIYKGADRFMHNYGTYSTFLGISTGNFALTGSDNTGVGNSALTSLTSGYYNSAIGSVSMVFNNSGYRNTALGYGSCAFSRTGNDNVAIGTESMLGNLFSSTNPSYNTAVGSQSLYSIVSGWYNTAVGYRSMYNTTGHSNSAFGYYSMNSNIDGWGNSAFGYHALDSLTSGQINTGIGWYAGSNITTGSLNLAIGNNSRVPNGTGINQVRIGDNYVSYAGINVAWTITSDRRFKSNIVNSNLGLCFISKLRPVSYFRINDEKQKTEYGLIAQEVEEVLKQEGVDNSAMITVTDEGKYELRYNDLLAPMIKAIQELNTENQNLKMENQNLGERLSKLEKLISEQHLTKEIQSVEK